MSQKAHIFLRGADKAETDIGEKEASPSPELHRTLRFMHKGKIVTGIVEQIVPAEVDEVKIRQQIHPPQSSAESGKLAGEKLYRVNSIRCRAQPQNGFNLQFWSVRKVRQSERASRAACASWLRPT